MSSFDQHWPGVGLYVNPGRRSNQLGVDEIHPYVDIPSWVRAGVVKMLEANGITFLVHKNYMGIFFDEGADEPAHYMDRFMFPDHSARKVQPLMNKFERDHQPKDD